MKHAKIIKNPYEDSFDSKAMDNIVDANGNVDWRAAHCADPGATCCPECNAYYWKEAEVLECECGCHFNTVTGFNTVIK